METPEPTSSDEAAGQRPDLAAAAILAALQAAGAAGLSPAVVSRRLAGLVAAGAVVREGSGADTRYYLATYASGNGSLASHASGAPAIQAPSVTPVAVPATAPVPTTPRQVRGFRGGLVVTAITTVALLAACNGLLLWL